MAAASSCNSIRMCQSLIVAVFACGMVVNSEVKQAVNENHGWHYGDEENWPNACKDGEMQSPIALSPSIAVEGSYPPFVLLKYNEKFHVTFKNNGHSAELRLRSNGPPSVRGGGLPHAYNLDHLHFHWKSEHTISDVRFPLELHLVHYANIYKNLSEAIPHVGGVSVFSVLFHISPDNDLEFDPLIDVIDKLRDKVNVTESMTINVGQYVPRDTSGYYRYNGSLTTPMCNEGVIWTVFTHTLPMSWTQMLQFSTMQDKDHVKIDQNYRSLQPINDRKVVLKASPVPSGNTPICLPCWLSLSVSFLLALEVLIFCG